MTAGKLADITFELEKIGKSNRLEKGTKVIEEFENEFHLLDAFTANKYLIQNQHEVHVSQA